MELSQLVGFSVLVGVLGVGLSVLLWAYLGTGSQAVLFETPVEAKGLASDTDRLFQRGCEEFKTGNYRKAASTFAGCLLSHPELAEAYHNRGLALANLSRDDDAVEDLLLAGERYAAIDRVQGLKAVREALAAIQARKRENV
ncbi:MAG: hypothetical protein J7641_13880 [Cyanobacteria bacterium SID2]|nr:hypothetical protein [Cyanobacteria bacterium SID2]MBP0002809.1 hypothetical protein [Cyanobacteria bacterium SBC]